MMRESTQRKAGIPRTKGCRDLLCPFVAEWLLISPVEQQWWAVEGAVVCWMDVFENDGWQG